MRSPCRCCWCTARTMPAFRWPTPSEPSRASRMRAWRSSRTRGTGPSATTLSASTGCCWSFWRIADHCDTPVQSPRQRPRHPGDVVEQHGTVACVERGAGPQAEEVVVAQRDADMRRVEVQIFKQFERRLEPYQPVFVCEIDDEVPPRLAAQLDVQQAHRRAGARHDTLRRLPVDAIVLRADGPASPLRQRVDNAGGDEARRQPVGEVVPPTELDAGP